MDAEEKLTNELPLKIFLKEIDRIIKKLSNSGGEKEQIEKLRRHYKALGVEFLLDDKKEIKREFSEIMNGKKPKAFLFGAGVSMDPPFKLPAWNKLLQRAVVGEMFKEYEIPLKSDEKNSKLDYNEFLSMLISRGEESDNYFNSFDLYELGQFIEDERKRVNNSDEAGKRRAGDELEYLTDSEMYEIVKKGLCLDYNQDIWKINEFGRYSLNKFIINEFPLINKLRDIVITNGIDRVITYNYDNAFEYTFSKEYDEKFQLSMTKAYPKTLQSVFLEEQFVNVNEQNVLPVYHVHGYIPIFNDSFADREYKEYNDYHQYPDVKKLILSEESYDAVEHASYKWRNVVQIDTFLRYNCVFFGFSATDKNFKRIVKLMGRHISRNAIDEKNDFGAKHYIFLNIDDYIENIFGVSVKRLINELSANNPKAAGIESILCYPSMNKKHVRFAIFSLAEYFSTLLSVSDGTVDDEIKHNIKDCKKKLFDYVNKINSGNFLAYATEEKEDINKAKIEYTYKKELVELFEELDKCISCIDKINSKTKTLSYLCGKIKERLDGLVPDVAMLIARLQCLHFTLRTKRKYLKKMHIYPIWTTIENLQGYINFAVK